MRLSDKRHKKLYNDVSDEVMKSRIEITKLMSRYNLPKDVQNEIDNVLFHLGQSAPQKALDAFK